MSTLIDWLKEANIPLSIFCEKLDVTTEYVIDMSHTADSDTQMDLYMKFVTVLNDEEFLPELLNFFSPYVSDKEELTAFITAVLKHRDNNIPRRMLNSIHRLVTLADEMEDVRPGKDSLKIFYFVVCIETLFHLRDGNVQNKAVAVINFFTSYIEPEDQQLILDRFRRSLGDEKYRFKRLQHEIQESYEERISTPDRMRTQIDMEVFARVINEIRNCFAHEGEYWNFNFSKRDYSIMNSLTVAENKSEDKLKRNHLIDGLRRVYSVDLTYDQFKEACVRGYLRLIREYYEQIKG